MVSGRSRAGFCQPVDILSSGAYTGLVLLLRVVSKPHFKPGLIRAFFCSFFYSNPQCKDLDIFSAFAE